MIDAPVVLQRAKDGRMGCLKQQPTDRLPETSAGTHR